MEQNIIQPEHEQRERRTRRILLACGILSSLLYLAMNIFVPMLYRGYSAVSQTISELSAVDAPTRPIWVVFGIIYTLLVTIFGWAVWQSAGHSRPLRIIGVLLIIFGVIGLGWPLAPMHQREVLAAGGGNISDTLHIVFSFLSVLLMMLAIGFGSAAFEKRFRNFSILTMIVLVVFGTLTGMDGPKIQTNEPTPWIGVWERICIGVYMLWILVLSYMLLKNERTQVQLNTTEAGMITANRQIKAEASKLQEAHH
jgi:hypothetical protein